MGMRKVAVKFGVATGTVQRIAAASWDPHAVKARRSWILQPPAASSGASGAAASRPVEPTERSRLDAKTKAGFSKF